MNRHSIWRFAAELKHIIGGTKPLTPDAACGLEWSFGASGNKDNVSRHDFKIAEPYFDRIYYCSANPDVWEARVDPLLHFLVQGWREGRNPSPLFDVNFYLTNNPDVAATGVNPLLHFIFAGKAEGRKGRDPLVGWRRQLDSAQAPSKRRPWAFIDAKTLASNLMNSDELIAKMKSLEAAAGLIISMSHDDYARSCGGVQNYISDEQKAFNHAGWHYLHISPAQPLQRLADQSSTQADFIVSLRRDGTHLGYASFADLITAIEGTSAQNKKIECVVHHLMGFSPELLLSLLSAAQLKTLIVWIHDLFTACESYTLLRNDIAFCGGPGLGSMACNICCYGEDRPRHYQRIRNFFEIIRPIILAPSQCALTKWRDFALPHRQGFVVPPARLILDKQQFSYVKGPQHQLRIAYVGQRAFHKGWLIFEELALRSGNDDRYKFIQLGLPADTALPGCIQHINVQVGPDDREAMIKALAAAHVDIVVLWSLWPETFCYVAHEALAAGAFIITRKAAGNVWPAIEAHAPAQGVALADQTSLFALFESGEVIRLVAESTRRRGALLPGGGTADWIFQYHPTHQHNGRVPLIEGL